MEKILYLVLQRQQLEGTERKRNVSEQDSLRV